jgi:hypothetical protein
MVLDNGSLNAQQVRIQALRDVIGWYKGLIMGVWGAIGWKAVDLCLGAWGSERKSKGRVSHQSTILEREGHGEVAVRLF